MRMDNSLPFTPAAQIIAGLLVLFLGRKLFWLFVGVVGFFGGLQIGLRWFAGLDGWLLLALSILVGLVCTGLAILLQRLAVGIAGGLVGGMLAMRLAPALGMHSETGVWVAFIVGALLAAVLLSVTFDPVLILLSAIVGAMMIAEALPLDPMLEPIVLGLCFLVGAAVQFRMYRNSRATSR